MTHESERIVGLYERQGRKWDEDRRRAHFIEKNWLDKFIALLPPGGHVLDIGCGGSEPIAGYLIGQKFSVTGMDGSPSMIALCRERHPEQQWLVHDMRGLSLARRFDGVIAWNSFFHLTPDDQRQMFPVFGAHAAHGAPLLFSSGPRNGEAIGCLHGEPLYHASLDPAEYRALLAANGFSVVEYVAEDPDCGQHTAWLARHDKDV
jgi:SAM-dependent methyltransferase